jgi:hypothetical protein
MKGKPTATDFDRRMRDGNVRIGGCAMATSEKKVATIVGGGGSAHVLIPFLSRAGLEVNILTRRPAEWSQEVELQLHSIHSELKRTFKGSLTKISDKPADVIPQADFIILCMPVCKYRTALHELAPHLRKDKDVFVGTIYGQAGFNWMVREIERKFDLSNVTTFAVGLIPWICRVIEYGKVGVTYGCKEVNVVAVSPPEKFDTLNDLLLKNICERWLKKGAFRQSANFLSLTLSVDNQIIHPSRCYGLFLSHGGKWAQKEDIPYFYRDYDEQSAELLRELDADYSKVRDAIKAVGEHGRARVIHHLANPWSNQTPHRAAGQRRMGARQGSPLLYRRHPLWPVHRQVDGGSTRPGSSDDRQNYHLGSGSPPREDHRRRQAVAGRRQSGTRVPFRCPASLWHRLYRRDPGLKSKAAHETD